MSIIYPIIHKSSIRSSKLQKSKQCYNCFHGYIGQRYRQFEQKPSKQNKKYFTASSIYHRYWWYMQKYQYIYQHKHITYKRGRCYQNIEQNVPEYVKNANRILHNLNQYFGNILFQYIMQFNHKNSVNIKKITRMDKVKFKSYYENKNIIQFKKHPISKMVQIMQKLENSFLLYYILKFINKLFKIYKLKQIKQVKFIQQIQSDKNNKNQQYYLIQSQQKYSNHQQRQKVSKELNYDNQTNSQSESSQQQPQQQSILSIQCLGKQKNNKINLNNLKQLICSRYSRYTHINQNKSSFCDKRKRGLTFKYYQNKSNK